MVRRHGRAPLLVAALAAVALSSCGGSGFRYVKSAEANTYFKVPEDWAQFDEEALLAAQRGGGGQSPQAGAVERAIQWSVGFDAATQPSVKHLLELDGATDPVVKAQVRLLLPDERRQVSVGLLRNLVLPVDQLEQQQAQQEQQNPMEAMTNPRFELLNEKELTPEGGLRGLRLVYNVQVPDGPVVTVDQTALVDQGTTRLYVLYGLCEASCYKRNEKLMNEIATSFTVKQED